MSETETAAPAAKRAPPKPAAPAVAVKKSRGVVTVASKLPQNLELQMSEFREKQVPGLRGLQPERESYKVGPVHYIHGTSYPSGQAPQGFPMRPAMSDGYALTYNIPEDFWDAWHEQNKDTDMVRNRVVFAMPSVDAAMQVAHDNKAVKSGLEPLNPAGDARNPKPLSGAVQPIRPDNDSMTSRPQTTPEQPEATA